jgi:hypothetical protein
MVTTATSKQHQATASGPDRLTSVFLVLAAFLAVLALLAWQLKVATAAPTRAAIVLRRVYQTRVIETVSGPSRSGPAVTQSVSSTASATPASAPLTSSASGASVP